MVARVKSEEIREVFTKFLDQNFAKYKSHSYSAGFLEMQLMLAMMDMPKRKQMEILECVKKATPEIAG